MRDGINDCVVEKDDRVGVPSCSSTVDSDCTMSRFPETVKRRVDRAESIVVTPTNELCGWCVVKRTTIRTAH